MRDFRTLKVWDRSHALTLEIYRATENFPREEFYGLTSQIRRSCVSIPTNIAEGCGRDGNAELVRFLRIASGSASELDYRLFLARELDYLPSKLHSSLEKELQEIRKMLTTLIKRLNNS